MYLIFLFDWKEVMNYPGLELWKFINLGIFLAVGIYILKKPLTNALRARRQTISEELAKAKQEKEAAQLRLQEAEGLLAHVDDEVQQVRDEAQREARSERDRLAHEAQNEIEKLKQQGERQVEMAHKVSRKTLREFLAIRSVELAGQSVRQRIRPEDDARLIAISINELRRGKG
jgi:F-type H+-transporting ATPase subunit b